LVLRFIGNWRENREKILHYKNWLTGIGLALAFCSAAQAAPQDYKIVGYYLARADANRHYTLADIQPAKLTHLNYAFAAIKDGEVALNDGIAPAQSEADFAELGKLKTANPHLRTLISVGGWAGSKDFSDIALTDATRARFAASAVRFVRQHHFDGVDIDWEFPVAGGDEGNARRPEDKHNYTLLFAELRKQLDRTGKHDHHHYLLTAAIGNNPQFLTNTEMDQVARILDWANIMTYDFAGHWNAYAGHHAPLYADTSLKRADADTSASVSTIVAQTLQAGVPPAKLVLGVPFYGYSWKQCGAENHGQLQDCQGKGRGSWEDGILDFADIDGKLLNKDGFTRYWNDTAKAAWLFNAETGEFVSYEDPQSLTYKIDYIKEHQLGGAMFWEISSDRQFVLQNQLANGLRGR
jgi:chitinase